MNEAMEERRESSLRDLLAVIFRRKGIVLGVLLAAVAAVAFLLTTSPVEYESMTQILVSRGQPESAFNSRIRVLTWEEELNSEVETAKSIHILLLAQKLLDDEKITDSADRPIHIDPDRVTAMTTGRSSVILIKYRGKDPKEAQEAARAITQAYTSFRLNVRAVPELEAFFREEIEGLRSQLDEWEQKRADFMSEEAVVGLSEERSSQIQIRQGMDVELNRIRGDLAEEQARLEVVRGVVERSVQDSTADPYVFSSVATNDDRILLQIRTDLVDRRSAYMAARSQFQDSHPDVMALKEQVADLERMLRRELQGFLRHQEARVDVLKAREDAMLNSVAYLNAELASYPSKEARLAAFDRVLQALRTDYAAMIDKQVQARLERVGSSDWNVLVLQPASKGEAVRLNDIIRLILIPLLSLLVGIALAFVVDGLDHSFKDVNEVERHLRLPVLGSLGRLR